jgi:hypothetical protein
LSLFGTGRKEGIGAVLVLIALVIVQHAPAWWGAATNDASDPFVLGLMEAGAAFREGGWPTWNHLAGDGAPFHTVGVSRFYPPYWPLALGWLPLAAVQTAHAALACVLAYRMLRALAASRYSAFVGAGLYGMGWFMTCALATPEEAFAACWLPWIVTCSWNLLFPRRRATSAVLLSAAVAIPFLTGGSATAWLGAALAALCILAGLLRIDRIDRRPTALHAAAAAGLAILFAAPVWLPTWASEAGHPAPSEGGPIPVAGLLGLFSPDLFGESGANVPVTVAQARNEATDAAFALYPGALVLLIALLGFLRPKRTWIPLFWICITGLALVLTIDHPLTLAVHRLAPVLGRHPAASLAVFHLGVVVLLALGLENFFDAPRARPHAVPVAAASLLLGALAIGSILLLGTPQLPGRLDLDAWLEHATTVTPRALIAAGTLALVFASWQRLGVLRLKRLVAVLALGEVLILGAAHSAQRTLATEVASATPEADAPLIGAAPPGGTQTRPSDTRRGFEFATRYRTLDRRPTPSEVRVSRDLLVESESSAWDPSTEAVEVLSVTPHTAQVQFEPASAPRLLVVRSTYAAGWTARTNQGPTRVLRADRSHQAIPVPAGADTLRLTYREPGLALGLALAASSVVFALGLLLFRRR